MKLAYRKPTSTLLILLLWLTLSACTVAAPELRGTEYSEPRQTPAFTLQNAAGEAVSLETYRGKVVPIYFGYTFCPDVCPLTMANLARVQSQMDEAGDDLQVLMITVDPQRDSATVVQDYVASFHPTFTGLSGTDEQIANAAAPFGVFYEKAEGSEASGYLVDHTARIFVIDKRGALRATYSYDASVEDLAADMRALIAE